MVHIRVTAVVISTIFILVTYWMLRNRRLKTSYALLWLCAAAAVVLMTIVPGALQLLSKITGLYYLTALLLLCFVFLLALFLHFSTVVSNLVYQNRTLAQRLAFMEKKLSDIESTNAKPSTDRDNN